MVKVELEQKKKSGDEARRPPLRRDELGLIKDGGCGGVWGKWGEMGEGCLVDLLTPHKAPK